MLQCKNLMEVSLTEGFLHKQRSMGNVYRKAEDVRVSQALCHVFKKIIATKWLLIKGLGELKGLV